MLSGLKPYPAYKDYGVPWLGDARSRMLRAVPTDGR